MEQEQRHDAKMNQLCIDVAVIMEKIIAVDKRINGSIDDFEQHISHGSKWRIAITVAALGLIGACLTAAVSYGEMKHAIKDNSAEIGELRK